MFFKKHLFLSIILFLLSSFSLNNRIVDLGITTKEGQTQFEILTDNFPTSKGCKVYHSYKKELDVFKGVHCAINLSEALLGSGYELPCVKGSMCWGECSTRKHRKHIVNASVLGAFFLKKYRDKVVELKGANYYKYVKGKKGIIYFENYWTKKEDRKGYPSGDHIDLWDGKKLLAYGGFGTWVRNHSNYTIEHGGAGPSPLQKAEKVYFIELR